MRAGAGLKHKLYKQVRLSYFMETTKLSTKGQVVIPEQIRAGLEEGTSFIVTRQGNLIVLKKIDGLTKKELKEMEELDRIWKEIDEGKGIAYESVNDLIEDIKQW